MNAWMEFAQTSREQASQAVRSAKAWLGFTVFEAVNLVALHTAEVDHRLLVDGNVGAFAVGALCAGYNALKANSKSFQAYIGENASTITVEDLRASVLN